MSEIDLHEPRSSKFWKLRNNVRYRLRDDAKAVQGPWRKPLGPLANREPLVLAEHQAADRRGVDLGYTVASYDADLFVPVYAAQAGEVSMAHEDSGFGITIDHGGWTWCTHYAHLSKMFVSRNLGRNPKIRQRVRAGEVLGYAAKSPAHIRFELWQWTDDKGFVAVDPVPHLVGWEAADARQLSTPVNKDAA